MSNNNHTRNIHVDLEPLAWSLVGVALIAGLAFVIYHGIQSSSAWTEHCLASGKSIISNNCVEIGH